MDRLDFISMLYLLSFILCSPNCFARRLTASNSEPWAPLIRNTKTHHRTSHVRQNSAFYSQGSQNSEDILAARVFADDDERISEKPADKSTRTLGGIYEQVPYQAGIMYKGQFRCGAVLVEEKGVKFFLTAASCVTTELQSSVNADKPKFFEFFLDTTDIRDINHNFRYTPEKIRIHPCYEPDTKKGNLAIVFVKGVIPTIPWEIEPAKLPLEEGYPFPIDVNISGYGDQHRGSEEFGVLNILTVGGWDWTFCREFKWQPGLFCVVDMHPSRPRGVCQFDQGGPAMGQYYEDDEDEDFPYLAGIISHVHNGLSCQKKGIPALVTQTSMYLPWILDEVNERNNAPFQKECVPLNCDNTEC